MTDPVLVAAADDAVRTQLQTLLERRGVTVRAVSSAEEVASAIAAVQPAVVVADLALTLDGSPLISSVRQALPDQEVLALANGSEGRSRALVAGASDSVAVPLDEPELVLALDRALDRHTLRLDRARLQDENLEFARSVSIHQRSVGFLSNPDLEWLQERVLSDLASVCDAQSAALWLTDDRHELMLRAYRGLLDKQFLSEKLDTRGALRDRLNSGAPWLSGEGRQRVMFVPLVALGELMGVAQLSDPLAGEFTAEHQKSARMLSDFAAVAVRNGKRFLALQRLGLRDRDTAAYNLSYFTDYASKEIYKARRYNRVFSLLTFSIDTLPQVKVRLGAGEAVRATRGIIRALSRIVRDSDVLAKASEQEFYLLLPETDFFGAMMFVRRAIATVREEAEVQAIEARIPLSLVSGAATFPKDGDDFDELVHRCRKRMDEKRLSLHRKLLLDGLSFWEEVELLLGSAASPKLPVDEAAEPSRRGKVSDALFEELQWEIARELLRDPTSRGVLYVGGPEIRAQMPIALGLEGVSGDFAPRVYVLGRRADLDSHAALTPVFLEGDERMAKHEFVLWLSEHSAYALLQRRGHGATWGFHTSDTAVVDGLIQKLQAEYDLQPY